MGTITYIYGIRVDKACLPALEHQVWLARKMYNECVAVMRKVYDDAQALIRSKADKETLLLLERIETLNADFQHIRSANAEEAVLKKIAQERRETWKALSPLLKALRQQYKKELQEIYNRVGINASCDTYRCRADAVKAGLGYATATAVLNNAILAWKTSMKQGRPPRFAKADKSTQDTLTLQFTAKGGLTQKKLFLNGSKEISIELPKKIAKRQYGHFLFRLGAAMAHEYASGTIQMHRPFPEGATVALARLVRKKVGCTYRYYLQFSLNIESQHRQAVGHTRKSLLSVHLGWNEDISGRRVCGITDAADPDVAQIIQLPPDIENDLQRAQDLQGKRDASRNGIAPKIRMFDDALPEGWDEETREQWAAFQKLPAQHMAISRIHYWRHRFGEMVPDWLKAWTCEDRKVWTASVHIARRARNRRDDYYRKLAKQWATGYEAIALEKLDLKTAALKVNERTGEKTDFAKKARAGRVVASLYKLESALRWSCEKWGTALLEHTEKTAQTCALCGANDLMEDVKNHQVLHCAGCGAVVDRKRNGAAVAWQWANEHREEKIADYWRVKLEKERSALDKKAERLQKMQKARRVKSEIS
ncbi:hypothetical protein ACJU26_06065 [Acidithiobacillus sp. M4-SHS-6]|uniref:hypothetical protein n=1 Tax=Acidithiobacillus sp. M4-SHS-6 TaxID=3383024 RepID=UPI0039BECC17